MPRGSISASLAFKNRREHSPTCNDGDPSALKVTKEGEGLDETRR